ncbi:AbrB/MazE/SpoVT family DNA-binding domain-containing protein [Novacetimonas cocois]|uniref:AbrB/MazE/SpoVT family DNA-binding domain-containing protein n=1 Tax=Novacetimonas cocois TaxID=1747507 RepID=UPI00140254DC|nr:transcriptional regulator [Novacetimonas cocois]
MMNVHEEDGRVIIEPVRATPLKLEDLVAEITDLNGHDEIDFGQSVGDESR